MQKAIVIEGGRAGRRYGLGGLCRYCLLFRVLAWRDPSVRGVIPDRWRLLYSPNPMVEVIGGGSWWCIGRVQSELYVPSLLASITVSAFFLLFGVCQFRKDEKKLREDSIWAR